MMEKKYRVKHHVAVYRIDHYEVMAEGPGEALKKVTDDVGMRERNRYYVVSEVGTGLEAPEANFFTIGETAEAE